MGCPSDAQKPGPAALVRASLASGGRPWQRLREGARMHLVLSFAIELSERRRHRRRTKPQREIRFPEAVRVALWPRPKGGRDHSQDGSVPKQKLVRPQVIHKDEGFFQARRAGCRDALMDGGVSPDQAEHWCATWEAEAARQGVMRGPYYWDAGRGWIDAQRAIRKLRWLTIAPDARLSRSPH